MNQPSPTTYPALTDTGEITYRDTNDFLARRPCHTWLTRDGYALSVVSEPSDTLGMSVINAAERVYAALTARSPSHIVRLFGHHPADTLDPERYTEITFPGERPKFTHISPEDLRALIGPTLDTTNPLRPDPQANQ